MKRTAHTMPFGSSEFNEQDGMHRGDHRDMQMGGGERLDILTPEKSMAPDMTDPPGYEGGIVSPVEGFENYNWADDHEEEKKANVIIWNKEALPVASFQCGVADSPQKKVIGLQSYTALGSSAGLLFPYEKPRDLLYHMGTVSFPIDIIFVSADRKIKKVFKNISPGSLSTFGCAEAKYVLEIYGGLSERLGISVGDKIDISKNLDAQKKTAALKSTIFTYSKVFGNVKMSWNDFSIVNVGNLNKKAFTDMTSEKQIKNVTAFFVDGLVDISGGLPNENIFSKSSKEIRSKTASFLNIENNDHVNKEINSFLNNMSDAKDNQVILCTSKENPKQLKRMLQMKTSFLESAKILKISKDFDLFNIKEVLKESFPGSNIEIRADESILRRAGIPVSDEVKESSRKALKILIQAEDIIDKSVDSLNKNKDEYEKIQGDEEKVKSTKGQYYQSSKRNSHTIKTYLLKIKEAIKILNDNRDIMTTNEVIEALVSAAKKTTNVAENIFDLKDEIESPEFFSKLTALTEEYEGLTEDLYSSIERAKDYINSNILGVMVLSD